MQRKEKEASKEYLFYFINCFFFFFVKRDGTIVVTCKGFNLYFYFNFFG
jgi:hypothetical protein